MCVSMISIQISYILLFCIFNNTKCGFKQHNHHHSFSLMCVFLCGFCGWWVFSKSLIWLTCVVSYCSIKYILSGKQIYDSKYKRV